MTPWEKTFLLIILTISSITMYLHFGEDKITPILENKNELWITYLILGVIHLLYFFSTCSLWEIIIIFRKTAKYNIISIFIVGVISALNVLSLSIFNLLIFSYWDIYEGVEYLVITMVSISYIFHRTR